MTVRTNTRFHFLVLLPLLLRCTAAFERPSNNIARSTGIVISQVYGAGGNSGASWRNDFVELFNSSPVAVDLKGLSVQYSPATGSSWQKTDLSGVIQPGGYYLIREASGGQSGAQLPAPDVIGTMKHLRDVRESHAVSVTVDEEHGRRGNFACRLRSRALSRPWLGRAGRSSESRQESDSASCTRLQWPSL
jgi:Lamin Tail Domain